MSDFPFFSTCVQVVSPLVSNGLFYKLKATKLARACLSRGLINVEEFWAIHKRSACGNDHQVYFLWKRLHFYASGLEPEYYEILKDILKGSTTKLSPEYKLFLKFEILEESANSEARANQCAIWKGELLRKFSCNRCLTP